MSKSDMSEANAGRLTRMVEGDLLAEYRYCEASFNGMRDHALELEAERDLLREREQELVEMLRSAKQAFALQALRDCADADILAGWRELQAQIETLLAKAPK